MKGRKGCHSHAGNNLRYKASVVMKEGHSHAGNNLRYKASVVMKGPAIPMQATTSDTGQRCDERVPFHSDHAGN
jgi:hypothetical protein